MSRITREVSKFSGVIKNVMFWHSLLHSKTPLVVTIIPKYRHYDIAYCYIIVPNKSHTLCCRRKEASIFQAF